MGAAAAMSCVLPGRLPGSLVDDKNVERHLDAEKQDPEAVAQIAYADQILLNKTDLVSSVLNRLLMLLKPFLAEAVAQIACADCVRLNKTDRASS